MLRRNFITAAGLLIGSSLGGREAIAEAPQSGRDKVAARLLKAFLSLPGKKSAQIDIDAPRHGWIHVRPLNLESLAKSLGR